MSPWCLHGGLALVALALFGLSCAYASVVPLPVPTGGRRAVARRRALAASPAWTHLEPQVRRVAALVQGHMPTRLQEPLSHQLAEAGHPLGLCASGLVVAGLGAAALGAGLGWAYDQAFASGALPSLAGGALGAALPLYRVRAARAARMQQISRALPGAIDLCALCMGAGLDFAASLQHIVNQAPDRNAPLVEELQHLLRVLSLGTTRAEALEQLAQAAPIPSVQELVAAIRQGEAKGTPLSRVLAVQAQLLRRRRSVAAEEAAARAGILLLLPLLLLMGCILLILFAPFVVNGFGL